MVAYWEKKKTTRGFYFKVGVSTLLVLIGVVYIAGRQQNQPEPDKETATVSTDISVRVAQPAKIESTPSSTTKTLGNGLTAKEERKYQEKIARINEMTERFESNRAQKFGLTSEQRATIRTQLDQLDGHSPSSEKRIRAEIIAFEDQAASFLYLKSNILSMSPVVAGKVISIMGELSAEDTRTFAMEVTHEEQPELRILAITHLGTIKGEVDTAMMETVASGMIDDDTGVQIASAKALSQLGNKQATAVLLKGLESKHAIVKAESLKALKGIWKSKFTAQLNDATQWKEFWKRSALYSKEPIKTSPLFDPSSGKATKLPNYKT